MKRRQVLLGASGIVAAGIGAAALASTAAAEAETGIFGVEESYEIGSQSGRLSSLVLEDITVIATWQNFDHPVESIEWTLEAARDSGEPVEIGTATANGFDPAYSNESGVTATMEDVDLVEVFGQDAFEVESDELYDGEDVTEHTDLVFTLTAVVTDAAGNSMEVAVTGDTDLGITNLGADISGGGSGKLSGEEESADEYDG